MVKEALPLKIILKIKYDDVKPFVALGRSEGVAFSKEGGEWYGIYEDGELIAFYNFLRLGSGARFRSNYTRVEWRRQGCLSMFINHAKMLCRERDVKRLTAFCTPMSMGVHLEHGAKRTSDKFIVYELGEK